MRLIGKLYRAEPLVKDWAPQRRLRLRSRYSRAVVREIEGLLLTHLHRVAPSSLLREAMHYLHGQWPKLVRFLDSGTWPLDSNPVENAIRPFVVGRRSWLFADTVGGANASAYLYSLIETAKANDIEPYRYLVALFKKLPLPPDSGWLRGAAALEHRTGRGVDRDSQMGSSAARKGVVD